MPKVEMGRLRSKVKMVWSRPNIKTMPKVETGHLRLKVVTNRLKLMAEIGWFGH